MHIANFTSHCQKLQGQVWIYHFRLSLLLWRYFARPSMWTTHRSSFVYASANWIGELWDHTYCEFHKSLLKLQGQVWTYHFRLSLLLWRYFTRTSMWTTYRSSFVYAWANWIEELRDHTYCKFHTLLSQVTRSNI